MIPFDFFPLIGLLLHLEHVIVEVLLQLLIGVVDAQLLEAINFEDFKSEDIQNSYDPRLALLLLVPFNHELLVYP